MLPVSKDLMYPSIIRSCVAFAAYFFASTSAAFTFVSAPEKSPYCTVTFAGVPFTVASCVVLARSDLAEATRRTNSVGETLRTLLRV